MGGNLAQASVRYKLAPGQTKRDNTLFIGAELEVEVRPNRTIDEMNTVVLGAKYQHANLFIESYDNMTNGREYVSHPMTWKFWQHQFPWEMFDRLNPIATSFDRTGKFTSGIHLHLSQAAFTKEHLYRFLWLHYHNRALITKVGGRDSQMGQFETSLYTAEQLKGRNYYSYDRTTPKKGTPTDEMLKLQADTGGAYGQPDRYMCVNLGHNGGKTTAELRYFRSTTNGLRFRGYLEFAYACYQYTLVASRPLTAKAIVAWMRGKAGIYENALAIIDGAKSHASEVPTNYKGEHGVTRF